MIDEQIEIDAACNDVAAESSGRLVMRAQRTDQFGVDLPREKGNLALVALLVIEEAMTPGSAS